MSAATKSQPAPAGDGTEVLALLLADVEVSDAVRADLEARAELGMQRYGTPLRLHNGRDALVDAYQEALDLLLYLQQAVEESYRPSLTGENAAWWVRAKSTRNDALAMAHRVRVLLDERGTRVASHP